MEGKKVKKYNKAELVNIARGHGYFKRPNVDFVWARQNGHFYYVKPPVFTDGLESYKILRSDLESKKENNKKNIRICQQTQ